MQLKCIICLFQRNDNLSNDTIQDLKLYFRHENPIGMEGVMAAPATDYVKRQNVFRLKQPTGGEYLFQCKDEVWATRFWTIYYFLFRYEMWFVLLIFLYSRVPPLQHCLDNFRMKWMHGWNNWREVPERCRTRPNGRHCRRPHPSKANEMSRNDEASSRLVARNGRVARCLDLGMFHFNRFVLLQIPTD